MKLPRLALAAALLLTAAGCSLPKVELTELEPLTYIRRTGDIDLYAGRYGKERLIRMQYREIALLKADDAGEELKDRKLIELLLEKAREIGADAVIAAEPADPKTKGWYSAGVFVEEKDGIHYIRGTAIRYMANFDL